MRGFAYFPYSMGARPQAWEFYVCMLLGLELLIAIFNAMNAV